MRKKRILVVDDDPDIVEYLCVFLEDNDYEVSSAESSEAAFAELERHLVDLLILDVLMPGRSGLDLLLTLRKDARWFDLPVVLLTGNDDVLREGADSYLVDVQAEARGADAILGKPLKPVQLLETLENLIA